MSTEPAKHTPPPRTGWPHGMLQDDSRELSRWLARRDCCICWRARAAINKATGEAA